MSSNKSRHNITMTPEVWSVLQELRRIKGQSISGLIETAIWAYIKAQGYSTAFFKIMSSAPLADEQENAELTAALDAITAGDLTVVEEYDLSRSTDEQGPQGH